VSRFCYRLHNDGLGDHWASLQLLAHMCHVEEEKLAYSHPDPILLARAEVILDLLDISCRHHMVGRLNAAPTFDLNGFDIWATPYFPTKRRWDVKRRAYPFNFICTHFDGISSAADKNPPPHEVSEILAWARHNKLSVIGLDASKPLSEVVGLLANCALFVGCDSGFSHIAHSTGTPCYLLEYKLPVVTCHRHKNYVLCKGAGHFTQQADNWLHYLRTLGSIAS